MFVLQVVKGENKQQEQLISGLTIHWAGDKKAIRERLKKGNFKTLLFGGNSLYEELPVHEI